MSGYHENRDTNLIFIVQQKDELFLSCKLHNTKIWGRVKLRKKNVKEDIFLKFYKVNYLVKPGTNAHIEYVSKH